MESSRESTRDRIVARIGVWRGVYHGGAYIDVFHAESDTALDCINVYDYAKGEPMIEFTREAVRAELRDWIDESSADIVEHVLPYQLH